MVNIDLDYTAAFIATPAGIGKYCGYCPHTGMVIVEMDYMYTVELPGEECYPLERRNPDGPIHHQKPR